LVEQQAGTRVGFEDDDVELAAPAGCRPTERCGIELGSRISGRLYAFIRHDGRPSEAWLVRAVR
jgi:hypothetical protein